MRFNHPQPMTDNTRKICQGALTGYSNTWFNLTWRSLGEAYKTMVTIK